MTSRVITMPSKRTVLAVWASIQNDEAGDAAQLAQWVDKTVQVTGTFDGETVTIQGSQDGTSWFTLHDLQDGNLAFTAADLEAIQENPLYIRPSVSGGAGSPDVEVRIMGVAIT